MLGDCGAVQSLRDRKCQGRLASVARDLNSGVGFFVLALAQVSAAHAFAQSEEAAPLHSVEMPMFVSFA